MFTPKLRRTDPFAACFIVLALVLACLVALDVVLGGSVSRAAITLAFCLALFSIGKLVDMSVPR